MVATRTLLASMAAIYSVHAHMEIAYPGWRGNNLITNGTLPQNDPNADVVTYGANGSVTYPWGMQFAYPCGGLPLTTNRTKWPVTGGAVAVQPGYAYGHSKSQFFINIGVQEQGMAAPPNMSHNVVPAFQVNGPSDNPYPGQFCMPNVPLPKGMTFKVGDNVTIQVVQLTQHGAALYSCVDVTLAEPNDPTMKKADTANCFNSSSFGFGIIFSTASLSGATSSISPPAVTAVFGLALLSLFSFL